LAALGAHVAITGRDPQRTENAARAIQTATGADVDAFVADLSSQAEVRQSAQEALQRLPRIDVVVNNVGGYWDNRHLTADGLERTFAVNHLAPFLLTHLLLDRLVCSAPARVVTVSSNAHALVRIDFDDLQGEHGYSGAKAYNQSKLGNVLFTYELARRLQTNPPTGATITANVLHPGVVNPSFGPEDPATIQRVLTPFPRPFMKTPTRGAATSYAASAPELEHVTGRCFANSKPRTPHPAATTRSSPHSSGGSAPTWCTCRLLSSPPVDQAVPGCIYATKALAGTLDEVSRGALDQALRMPPSIGTAAWRPSAERTQSDRRAGRTQSDRRAGRTQSDRRAGRTRRPVSGHLLLVSKQAPPLMRTVGSRRPCDPHILIRILRA
jgi:NAD(P)-dependent dehydrogenase (short-subunit alcohol dehydrogenase family)